MSGMSPDPYIHRTNDDIGFTCSVWSDRFTFLHQKVKKSGRHSQHLPNINVFTLQLRHGPHGTPLGGNDQTPCTAVFFKTHGLTVSLLSITTQQ